MAETARAEKIRAGAPSVFVYKRVAGFLVRADAFDFGALTGCVVPVAVAVPPVVRVIAQRHPHRVASRVGEVDKTVRHERFARDQIFDLRFFNALEAGEVRRGRRKSACDECAETKCRHESFHGIEDANLPVLVTLPPSACKAPRRAREW